VRYVGRVAAIDDVTIANGIVTAVYIPVAFV